MVMPKWPVNKVWVRLIITAKVWVGYHRWVGCLSAKLTTGSLEQRIS